MTTNGAAVVNSNIYEAIPLQPSEDKTTATENHCAVYRYLRISIIFNIVTIIFIAHLLYLKNNIQQSLSVISQRNPKHNHKTHQQNNDHLLRSYETKDQLDVIDIDPIDTIEVDSFQGVFEDPNHPQGYRIIVDTCSSRAQLQLQDEPDGEIFFIPVNVLRNTTSLTTQLIIDFSAKGGPSDLIANVQDGGNLISFSDGNAWSKLEGIPGVYYDKADKRGYFTIRLEEEGTVIIVAYVMMTNDCHVKTFPIPATISGDTIVFHFSSMDSEGIFRNGIIEFKDHIWVKA